MLEGTGHTAQEQAETQIGRAEKAAVTMEMAFGSESAVGMKVQIFSDHVLFQSCADRKAFALQLDGLLHIM